MAGLSDSVSEFWRSGLAPVSGGGLPTIGFPTCGCAACCICCGTAPRVLAFAEREQRPLLHDDTAGTQLIAALTAYLEAGGNKAAAAKRANLARPTLYERLRNSCWRRSAVDGWSGPRCTA